VGATGIKYQVTGGLLRVCVFYGLVCVFVCVSVLMCLPVSVCACASSKSPCRNCSYRCTQSNSTIINGGGLGLSTL